MISLRINGKTYEVEVRSSTPLLWVLRDHLGLTGTKYGCGISQCGACTVHVNGEPTRSCVTPVSSLAGKEIVTIEGLSAAHLHPLQQAWIEDEVPQCGYCQSGQIMTAAALLTKNPKPADGDIDRAMSGVLCRCGTYQRIRRAIHRAAEIAAGGDQKGFEIMASRKKAPAVFLNPFVGIGTDDTITIVVNKSEMGQGVYTSLPMLLAEELECDWEMISLESAPVSPSYNHPLFGFQLTGGSTSVPSEWERMRRAGAEARERLIAAAAELWKVKKEGCRVEKGRVVHTSGKMLTYGQLVEKAAAMPAPEQVILKDPSTFTVIGRPVHRLDTPQKVNGEAIFGMDAKVPRMVTSVIARCPVFGGKVRSFNTEKARAVSGVEDVVSIESGVAVAATDFWSANLGRRALEIIWDKGEGALLSSDTMRERYAALAGTPGAVARREGDYEGIHAKAAKRISAEYEVPYLAHAVMEPLNCLVVIDQDGCHIWTGTQFQTVDRDAAARVTGLNPDQVKIHTTLLGGGFGRRANPRSDFVVEAVRVAKALKRPVKVVWTREDDIKGGYYRPMWFDRMDAGLDSKGALITWHHTIVGQSILKESPFEEWGIEEGIDSTSVEGAKDIPYRIPHILVDLHSPELVVPVQWWRSVGHSHTSFAVESFMDEAAHLAGRDPLAFRLKLLSPDQRQKGVLELAADRAGWGNARPPGRALGIAVHESFGSCVAQVAEVSLEPEGGVRIHRVVCAINCGRVVNPDTVRAQMEGSVVFGLSAALYGAITLKDGVVEQSNFNDYRLLRINEMPEVEVHIVPSEEPPGGVGEPGVPPIAPAVTNAIFALTGKRIRRLPIGNEALSGV